MKKFYPLKQTMQRKVGGKFGYVGRTLAEMPDDCEAASTYQMTVLGSDGLPLK